MKFEWNKNRIMKPVLNLAIRFQKFFDNFVYMLSSFNNNKLGRNKIQLKIILRLLTT